MVSELLRLCLGFFLAAFHRPIADFIMKQEQVLVMAFRQRGLAAPVLSEEAARNIYFCLGIFIMLLEMGRIWGIMHPDSLLYALVAR